MKKVFIVVGLGYGDEGKGIATDFLSYKNSNSIVVRFNGGHQAGHCVVNKMGEKHIFSNFGSGTMRGLPTYWSKYCTFAPNFFIEEASQLNFDFKFFIDIDSPITTHYDVLYNRAVELTLDKDKRKGSCGVGFGATIERSKTLPFCFQDILNEVNLKRKLSDIRKFYRSKINIDTSFNFNNFNHDLEDNLFCESVSRVRNLIDENKITVINDFGEIIDNWDNIIFEGSQGIMIDQNFGTKPYITKSNTTSQNVFNILEGNKNHFDVNVLYVTRVYQTRHGNGPFDNLHKDFILINNHNETNVENEFQGKPRTNFLNIDKLIYAIECDEIFSKNCKKSILFTCLDHLPNENVFFYKDGNLQCEHYTKLAQYLNRNFDNVFFSKSNFSENIFK
ncbi:adenylosuccinate synthetase [uncultured Chryseobacterium sp.]|uniref:adenylosuccinate synthetase n=1 Tax=uncultured Chryseobacterium sp. TaxID=259322 RepID=UPI0025CCDCF0|nr:adenylosuccinate synthetase [uncultured Chryseobacterium sp.]